MKDTEDALRDKFAMAALTGILANPYTAMTALSQDHAVGRAYDIADRMLGRRKAPKGVHD